MLTVVSSYHLSFVRFFVVQTGESGKKSRFMYGKRGLGGMEDLSFFPLKLT